MSYQHGYPTQVSQPQPLAPLAPDTFRLDVQSEPPDASQAPSPKVDPFAEFALDTIVKANGLRARVP